MDDLLQWAGPLLAPAFSLWGSPVTWLEMLAFVLSLAMVVCNIRVNPMAWPLAIAASLLYFVLFWDSRLYGEAALQIVFAVVAGWGWWQWLRGRAADGSALRVRHLSGRARLALLAAVLVAWPLLGAFLRQATDTDVPWWDALPTAGSLAGQWLLARKYVDNWPVWVVVNAVSVSLFAWKGLWLTAVLYALFLGMALWGWHAWQRLAAAR
jgi:nicotinamide mononucleotide transporter